jgi:hypothetical protein
MIKMMIKFNNKKKLKSNDYGWNQKNKIQSEKRLKAK